MNRRQFFGRVLGPIAATVAVPDLARTIFLPPQGGWPVNMSRYLTGKNAWFLKTEQPVAALCVNGHPWCNRCVAPLTERAMEEMLDQIVRIRQRISIKPTHLFVHPSWTREQVEARLAQL